MNILEKKYHLNLGSWSVLFTVYFSGSSLTFCSKLEEESESFLTPSYRKQLIILSFGGYVRTQFISFYL